MEEKIRKKERIIRLLGSRDASEGDEKGQATSSNSSVSITKQKPTNRVWVFVDIFLDVEAGSGFEVELCQVWNMPKMIFMMFRRGARGKFTFVLFRMFKECFEWTTTDNRVFLHQSLVVRLVQLYKRNGMFSDALTIGGLLLLIVFTLYMSSQRLYPVLLSSLRVVFLPVSYGHSPLFFN